MQQGVSSLGIKVGRLAGWQAGPLNRWGVHARLLVIAHTS